MQCECIFVRRIKFDPDAHGSTTLTTGWFAWERGYLGEPALRWISDPTSINQD